MGLEKRRHFFEDLKGDHHGLDETYYKSGGFRTITDADLAMEVGDEVVHAYCTAGTMTITLPSVVAAKGRIYTIWAYDGTGTITVEDKADDAGLSDITLDADDENVVLYSNGYKWFELVSGYS